MFEGFLVPFKEISTRHYQLDSKTIFLRIFFEMSRVCLAVITFLVVLHLFFSRYLRSHNFLTRGPLDSYPENQNNGFTASFIGSIRMLLKPPLYLSVNGWKDCVEEKSMGTWNAVCLPSDKPEACSTDSWNKLSNMDLANC
jgi:hypothetical protein